MIQDVFIKNYPQAAIDKYISVMRQLYSKVPEEKEKGNVSENHSQFSLLVAEIFVFFNNFFVQILNAVGISHSSG